MSRDHYKQIEGAATFAAVLLIILSIIGGGVSLVCYWDRVQSLAIYGVWTQIFFIFLAVVNGIVITFYFSACTIKELLQIVANKLSREDREKANGNI